MVQNVWTVASSSSSVDQQTNTVSLFSVVEALQLEIGVPEGAEGPVYPVPFSLHIVSLWTRETNEPEQADARVRLILPNGDAAIEAGLPLDFQGNRRLRTIARLASFPLDSRTPGVADYWVETDLRDGDEWRAVSRIPIEVTGRIVVGELDPPAAADASPGA